MLSINLDSYDSIIEKHFPNPDWDFFLITDDGNLESKFWKVIHVGKTKNPKRQSRFYKWLIHRFFNCQYSLYIDASVKILCDLNGFADRYLKESDIAMYGHRCRKCLYEEALACKKLKIDSRKVIDRQIAEYRRFGYPANYGLNEGTIILRRHTPQIAELNELVWNEISKGSYRDQIAFNWCAWKLGIKVNNINGMIKLYPKAKKILEKYKGIIVYNNPYFELKEHKN